MPTRNRPSTDSPAGRPILDDPTSEARSETIDLRPAGWTPGDEEPSPRGPREGLFARLLRLPVMTVCVLTFIAGGVLIALPFALVDGLRHGGWRRRHDQPESARP